MLPSKRTTAIVADDARFRQALQRLPRALPGLKPCPHVSTFLRNNLFLLFALGGNILRTNPTVCLGSLLRRYVRLENPYPARCQIHQRSPTKSMLPKPHRGRGVGR